MPKQPFPTSTYAHHVPSTSTSMPNPKPFETTMSPSSPRQLPKLRLMLSENASIASSRATAGTPGWKIRGHKRHRDNDAQDRSIDGRDEKRPTIKLRNKGSESSTPQHQPLPSSSTSSTVLTSIGTGTKESHSSFSGAPTSINFFPSGEQSTSCSNRMDIDTSRPSTPTLETPPTKRPRSHSNPSSIVGLLFDETGTAPSSPVDGASCNSIAHMAPTTPNMSSKSSLHPPHVPSPLASKPILGLPSDLPVATPHPLNRAISDPSPSRDIDMTMTMAFNANMPLTPDRNTNNANPKTQLHKARHKLFMAEVEALGTEMNNVFKLGYGRGMGRAVGGGSRGPSRLRTGLQEDKSIENLDGEMDVDD